MRFRHDDSDLFRISRQQKFLQALAGQLFNKDNIFQLPQIAYLVLGSFDTNIDEYKAFELIAEAKQVNNFGHIHAFTLAGSGMMLNHGYYMKPDKKYVDYVVTHYLNE